MQYGKKLTTLDMLKNYTPLCEENDYIEVSKWINGEGYDININGIKQISVSFDEFEAIKHLISCLTYETDKFKDKKTI